MAINLRQLLLDRAARGIGTGGGLLNNKATGGLLGNLNPFFLGASIIGSGMQGRDPFSSVLPAATQTAQLQQLLTPEEKERRIVKGADGFQYYADTGERVLPGVKASPKDSKERRIIKDIDGRQRYADTGELVFPNVKTPTPKDESAKIKRESIKSFQQIYKDNATVKNYNTAQEQLNKVLAGAEQDSAAGDVSLIFTFMKVLDPTSVVREGEQATAANAAGIPSRVRNAFNKALTGEKLSEEQRKDFVNTAIKLFRSNTQSLDIFRNSFSNALSERDIKKSDIFFDTDFRPKQINVSGEIVDVPSGTFLQSFDIQTKEYIFQMPNGTLFKIKR